MRLPRIRIWFLMAIVAIVAILVAVRIMSERSRFFRSQAAVFAARASKFDKYIELLNRIHSSRLGRGSVVLDLAALSAELPLDPSTPPEVVREHYRLRKSRKQLAAVTRQRDYYAQLKQKYEWAATHPWQSVPPDPPVPSVPSVPPERPEPDPDAIFESPWKSWRPSPP
jgi:hypothetical protein